MLLGVSNVQQPGGCISKHILFHLHTPPALPSTKTYGHPTTGIYSFFCKQNGNQNSLRNLHLPTPERTTSHSLYVSVVLIPFFSTVYFSLSIWLQLTAFTPFRPSSLRNAAVFCTIPDLHQYNPAMANFL